MEKAEVESESAGTKEDFPPKAGFPTKVNEGSNEG
jgi:hypothetical protein